jgi:hypothetical protein
MAEQQLALDRVVFLPGGRIFGFDPITALAAIFVLLLYGAFSNRAFTIGGNYFVEIPLVMFAVSILLVSGTIDMRVVARAANVTVLAFFFLFVFFVIGLMRGAPLADAYADLRSMLTLVGATAILMALPDRIAIRFIAASSILCLLSFAFIYLLGLQTAFMPKDALDTGKVTLPWLAFIDVCIIFVARRSWLWVPCLLLSAFVGFHTSYRYVYVALAMTAVTCSLIPLLRSKKFSAAVKLIITAPVLLALVEVILTVQAATIVWITRAEMLFTRLGVPSYYIHQLFDKSLQNIETGLNWGDYIYLEYAHSLFDVERFFVPQGLGHKSSYGDPLIFGGNTIDNSIIFLDYHFGIWFTFSILIGGAYIYLRRTRGASWYAHAQYMLVLAPILAMVYIRAMCFVDVLCSLSLAFTIRLLATLISAQPIPLRAVDSSVLRFLLGARSGR